MASKDGNPMGDAQGTRVGKPDRPGQGSNESPHDGHAPDSLGAGAEAATNTDEHDREHRSGYGGAGGSPVAPSDTRQGEEGKAK